MKFTVADRSYAVTGVTVCEDESVCIYLDYTSKGPAGQQVEGRHSIRVQGKHAQALIRVPSPRKANQARREAAAQIASHVLRDGPAPAPSSDEVLRSLVAAGELTEEQYAKIRGKAAVDLQYKTGSEE